MIAKRMVQRDRGTRSVESADRTTSPITAQKNASRKSVVVCRAVSHGRQKGVLSSTELWQIVQSCLSGVEEQVIVSDLYHARLWRCVFQQPDARVHQGALRQAPYGKALVPQATHALPVGFQLLQP